jgi:hypothetical protein
MPSFNLSPQSPKTSQSPQSPSLSPDQLTLGLQNLKKKQQSPKTPPPPAPNPMTSILEKIKKANYPDEEPDTTVWEQKYLKYKQKYLKLKKELNL